MDRLKTLRRRLAEITPAHDHPVGLVHPYWARKPHNVISEIIGCLTDDGHAVADPFMGSGTILFSALGSGRAAFGSDLNPLAVFIVSTLLDLRRLDTDFRAEARRYFDELAHLTLPWFAMPDGDGHMERERFQVDGSFEQGRFTLRRCEVVAKRQDGHKWRGRRAVSADVEAWTWGCDPDLLGNPLDFEAVALLPNSRIAIPRGARLSHFFSPENRAFINAALQRADAPGLGPGVRDMRRLLLSSALPLLRLSDKKATSQWPYWRPRNLLTSRNPVIVLGQRVEALLGVLDWLEQALPSDLDARVLTAACQQAGARPDLQGRFHLVLTDPPYSDHVPYLEYAALWNGVLGLQEPANARADEIVNTDAPSRRDDTAQYAARLGDGLEACAALTRPGGYLVWFYQDTALAHWQELDCRARACGLQVADVIAIPKQRRSMKTVTTPRRTLDGDLILVFRRLDQGDAPAPGGAAEEALEPVMDRLAATLDAAGDDKSFFERYALVIREVLLGGGVQALAARYKKVTGALRALDKRS